MSAPSRRFQVASRSAAGALPIRPGWMSPVDETPGTCREVAVWPRESQITLQASGNWSVRKPPPFCLAEMPV
jgi:hypothetical protein